MKWYTYFLGRLLDRWAHGTQTLSSSIEPSSRKGCSAWYMLPQTMQGDAQGKNTLLTMLRTLWQNSSRRLLLNVLTYSGVWRTRPWICCTWSVLWGTQMKLLKLRQVTLWTLPAIAFSSHATGWEIDILHSPPIISPWHTGVS